MNEHEGCAPASLVDALRAQVRRSNAAAQEWALRAVNAEKQVEAVRALADNAGDIDYVQAAGEVTPPAEQPRALGICPRCGDVVGLIHSRPECDARYEAKYRAAARPTTEEGH